GVSGMNRRPSFCSARAIESYPWPGNVRELERQNLSAVLEKTNGRVAGAGGAAELLGIKPSTLAYQLKTFGIARR
ncbi:MAG TPA: helix-turn-helix domain-containing protein, partial [Labilithrix sp.]|nr:helix-turn-helix domain-containing protein [Labilithrix sp.]